MHTRAHRPIFNISTVFGFYHFILRAFLFCFFNLIASWNYRATFKAVFCFLIRKTDRKWKKWRKNESKGVRLRGPIYKWLLVRDVRRGLNSTIMNIIQNGKFENTLKKNSSQFAVNSFVLFLWFALQKHCTVFQISFRSKW